MDVLVREHEVSATILEVILKGIPKDTIKLSEFENKFKPTLQGIKGVVVAHLNSGYGNAFDRIQVEFESGLNKKSLANEIGHALGQVLDLKIKIVYREADPLDYL